MPEKKESGDNYSFYDAFVPLTSKKAVIFIAAIGFVVYFNMLFNGFVLDDKTFILFNQEIHSFNFGTIFGPSLFNTGYYRPIPAFYFSFLFLLFRDTTFFYHFLQLSLHILNTSLLFILFNKFFNKKLAFFLSIFFLVHPIQVESVSYIASSGNELFFLFGIVALLLSTKSVISVKRFTTIFILLLLSLLSRETGLLFFIVVLLYRFLFEGKKQFPFFFFGGLIISVIYLILRLALGNVFLTKFAFVPIARLSLQERISNIPAIIFSYLKTFFFPLNLVSQQQWVVTNFDIKNFYVPLAFDIIFFLLVGLLGIYIYRNHKKYLKAYVFFLVWLIIGFLPQIQIFPLDMTVADRWFYFQIVGILALIGVSIQILKFKVKHIQVIGYIFAIALISIFSIRTIIRNANWIDALTLDKHDSEIQTNYELEDNLGFDYQNIGNYKEALKHYKASINLYADEGNLYNLARTYEQMGNNKKAIEYYSKTITSKNIQPYIHEEILQATYPRYALLLIKIGDIESAKKLLTDAIRQYPQSGTLWTELAICEYNLHNQHEAIIDAEKGKSLSSDILSAYVVKQISTNQPINIANIN